MNCGLLTSSNVSQIIDFYENNCTILINNLIIRGLSELMKELSFLFRNFAVYLRKSVLRHCLSVVRWVNADANELNNYI